MRVVASPGEVLRPHIRRIRQPVDEGAIGQVCWAACGAALGSYHQDEPERQGSGPLENVDPSWYFRNPGGGQLYDMTVCALHGLTAVLGSVKRVSAMSGVRVPERQFAFAYGTAAGILTGDGVDSDVNGRYYGTEGQIVGLLLNGEPFDYPGRELAQSAPADGNQWLLPHVTEPHRDLLEQHVFEDVMQLVDWVRLGLASEVSAEHARHVIEIIECAYRAALTGETQSLATTVEGLADR